MSSLEALRVHLKDEEVGDSKVGEDEDDDQAKTDATLDDIAGLFK